VGSGDRETELRVARLNRALRSADPVRADQALRSPRPRRGRGAERRDSKAALSNSGTRATSRLFIEAKREVFRVPMKLSGGRWVGRLSKEISLGVEPVFASMKIPSGSGLVLTPPRWIDNERAIETAARDRHVDPNHEVFSGRGFGGASAQRIMEAIYAISSSLLNFETPDLSPLSKERSRSTQCRARGRDRGTHRPSRSTQASRGPRSPCRCCGSND
jgi:hypothetical protein